MGRTGEQVREHIIDQWQRLPPPVQRVIEHVQDKVVEYVESTPAVKQVYDYVVANIPPDVVAFIGAVFGFGH